MKFPMRRVVTGHDETGNAVVQIDEVSSNIISKRPNHKSYVVWTTRGNPVDNSGSGDDALEPVETALVDGSVFRIMHLSPGVAPRRHRTNSVDYLIVLSGAVTMELDGDVKVELKAGDLVVQRGTIHNWVNNGTEPCIMAVVLIDAKPAEVKGRTLNAAG